MEEEKEIEKGNTHIRTYQYVHNEEKEEKYKERKEVLKN